MANDLSEVLVELVNELVNDKVTDNFPDEHEFNAMLKEEIRDYFDDVIDLNAIISDVIKDEVSTLKLETLVGDEIKHQIENDDMWLTDIITDKVKETLDLDSKIIDTIIDNLIPTITDIIRNEIYLNKVEEPIDNTGCKYIVTNQNGETKKFINLFLALDQFIKPRNITLHKEY